MNLGFLGIQVATGLQISNASAIFESLGASTGQIPALWLGAPVAGLIVQPIVGNLSDKTWNRFGHRQPYFLGGAIFAAIALILMVQAAHLWIAVTLYWGLQIVTCIVLPLILLTRKSTKATVLGAALIVIGIIGVRFDIVVPALLVPVMHGLPVGEYAPNLLEWATSAGMIAFGLLLYTVCVQILPLADFQDLEH